MFDAVKEAIAVGERAGVPVDIIHLKIADQKYWGRMNEVVALIEAARSRGVNVQANVYPYTRGNNNLASIIPPWAHEGGKAQLLERLKDPTQRERMKKDIRDGIPGWYNHYTAVGGDWSRMLVSGKGAVRRADDGPRHRRSRSQGKIADARPARRALRPADRRRRLGPDGLCPSHRGGHEPGAGAAVVLDRLGRLGLRDRGPAAARQSAPAQLRHVPARAGRLRPRAQACCALEDAVRKMTSLNAAKLGLADRGLVRPGISPT